MASVNALATLRLIGRRMTAGDFELLRLLHQNEAVAATLGGILSDTQVSNSLNDHLAHFDSYGYGLWIFHSKATGCFVGRGGLRNVFVGGHDEVEVAYALMPEFWNQGLATEIAQASVEIGFMQCELPELVSFTLPTNVASRRVMEKAGFRFERDIVYKKLPYVLYRQKGGALLTHGNRADRSNQKHCSDG
jgi:[ribosomal protein S5]-alanine N-acetyltransferase